MNLKSNSRICSAACFFLLSAVSLFISGTLSGAQPEGDTYVLHEGRLYHHTPDSVTPVRIDGRVDAFYSKGKTVVYLRASNGDERRYYIGIKKPVDQRPAEKEFAFDTAPADIRKFAAKDDAAYILLTEKSGPENAPLLFTVDLASMSVTRLAGIADFYLAGSSLILLEKKGRGYSVRSDAGSMPVSVSGVPRFVDCAGGRLLMVSGGDEIEAVDIIRMKSVYLYSSARRVKEPKDHNLIIEASDTAGSRRIEKMVFYKVFIDGVNAGRTDSGIAQLPVSCRSMTEAGRDHIVRIERWELKRALEKYERVNNIHQPESVKLYIPVDRVIKLGFVFDGKKYAVTQSVVFEEEGENK